jgi:hypothetical protein
MARGGCLALVALALAGVAYAEKEACLIALKIDSKASQVRGRKAGRRSMQRLLQGAPYGMPAV